MPTKLGDEREALRCASCGNLFEGTSDWFSNFCSTCAGKVFMGQYVKQTEEAPTVKELLELSTLYHGLITELVDLWGVELTPALRARAFQIVTDFSEQLKMKTLASAVLADIKENVNANS